MWPAGDTALVVECGGVVVARRVRTRGGDRRRGSGGCGAPVVTVGGGAADAEPPW